MNSYMLAIHFKRFSVNSERRLETLWKNFLPPLEKKIFPSFFYINYFHRHFCPIAIDSNEIVQNENHKIAN